MLIVQNLTYTHSNREVLFDKINLSISGHEKIALVGNNGAGKSTLLKIISGMLKPAGGVINAGSKPYYVPQHFGQFNELTIAQALQIDEKLKALKEIFAGNVTALNMEILNDDWDLEIRSANALAQWQLGGLDLDQQMHTLSGGQKTKIFLAGIAIHQPAILLLDEPSNHLDLISRNMLYDLIKTTTASLLVVSHDRALLNLLDYVYELDKNGITAYGGNYDFYKEQKMIAANALDEDIKSNEKALRKAKETERETGERKAKLDARGKKKQEKAGLPTISMKTFKNNAEKSAARIKGDHSEKVETILQSLNKLRNELPGSDKMKFGFDSSVLHKGKVLVTGSGINFSYGNHLLWKQALDFKIISGERLCITGANGSGKTTLIKLLLGEIQPVTGVMERADFKAVYIDQDYSLINDDLTVYQQAEAFNYSALQEHEIKLRLNRFLFTRDYWDKPCITLSGGEKMRMMLCCLTISNKAPAMIVLDEPTNNLDMQNIEILTHAVNDYKGTIIVISHDVYFLKAVNVEKAISMESLMQ